MVIYFITTAGLNMLVIKNKSNQTLVVNNTNVYSHFVFNPNLLPVRSVSEVNNLYIGSRFINPRSSYILYPIRL